MPVVKDAVVALVSVPVLCFTLVSPSVVADVDTSDASEVTIVSSPVVCVTMVPGVEDISVADDPLVKPCVSVICDVVEKLAVVPAVSDDCVTVGTLVVVAGAVVTGGPVDSDILVPEVADDCVTVEPLVTVAGSALTEVPVD